MKRLVLSGLLVLAPAAFGASSVLTSKGMLYSIDAGGAANTVTLTRRSAMKKESLIVPATADETRDHSAQLEYDRAADRLYVVWIRGGDVVMSWLDGDAAWSEPLVVSSAASVAVRDELHSALTRAKSDEIRATLIHVAAWVKNGASLVGEYTLVAFENGAHVSTAVTNFENLDDAPRMAEQEEGVAAVFPPLAMAAAGDGVDVVFGREHSTSVTRVHITPRLEGHARAWRPVGKTGTSMPPARFAAMSTAPVRALFSRHRVVLYTNDEIFRFVVFENGEWSSVRALALDDQLTGEALLTRIRQSIEEDLAPSGSQPVSQ